MPFTMNAFRQAVLAAMDKKAKSEEQTMQEKRYNAIEELPGFAQSTITKLVDRKFLNGYGTKKDADGKPTDLNLSEDMVRLLVILDSAGVFDA